METKEVIAPEIEKVVVEGTKEKIEKIETEAYERRKGELADIEARVDKKMKELNSIVEEVGKYGKGFAGQHPTQKSPKEIEKEELIKKYSDRGPMNPFAGAGAKALED